MDTQLSEREELNKKLQTSVDIATDPWGIKVTGVTIKDVSLPDTMMRAIAKQAEAEREKRARIILSEGEYKASEMMSKAAEFYQRAPAAMKLRELQTLAEISRDHNLIIANTTNTGGIDIGTAAGISKAVNKQSK